MQTRNQGLMATVLAGWILFACWQTVGNAQNWSVPPGPVQGGSQPVPGMAPPPSDQPQPVPYGGPPAVAGQQPMRQTGPLGAGSAGGPDQPVVPRDPVLVPRQHSEQIPYAPFTLTPQQQAVVDWVLQRWEQRGSQIKTFECQFTRFEYDAVFGDGKTPLFVDQGEIKYIAPDKGLFRVLPSQQAGETREEQWVCNGEAIYQFDYQKKQLVEHKLPPEMQGKAISEGPLPFVFGARAETLMRRYFVRIVTPTNVQGQVWLEAWPRWQADAANFQRATVILTADDMLPFAIETIAPNGKNRTVYRLQDPKINARNLLDPLNLFQQTWLRPRTPAGWRKVVEEHSSAQTAQSVHQPATR